MICVVRISYCCYGFVLRMCPNAFVVCALSYSLNWMLLASHLRALIFSWLSILNTHSLESIHVMPSIRSIRRKSCNLNSKIHLSSRLVQRFCVQSVGYVAKSFYRAMLHRAWYCYGKSSLSPPDCPSVTLRYRDHIGWKLSKIISRLVNLGCSLSADPNIMNLLQREHPKILTQSDPPPINWASQTFRHSMANCGRMVRDIAKVIMGSV